MHLTVESDRTLRFEDGSPVTAASALAPYGDGWLVAQDDATHAAWLTAGAVRRLRLFPPVDGLDVFRGSAGTEHQGPGLEAACALPVDGRPAVLLLGSGAAVLRRRAVLVGGGAEPEVVTGDLGGLYDAIAGALGLGDGQLDLEGVARNGPVLRCFHRGAAGSPSGSVDVGLPALVQALLGRLDPADVPVRDARTYDLGEVAGVPLAATDAVALPGGRVLLSAAAGDGQVVGAALVLLQDDEVVDRVVLPELRGVVQQVEGLGIEELDADGVRLRAVVDPVDPEEASVELRLAVRWT